MTNNLELLACLQKYYTDGAEFIKENFKGAFYPEFQQTLYSASEMVIFELHRKLGEAISAMNPQEGWLPIESAPRDGTEILVFNTSDSDCGYRTEPNQIGIAYWQGEGEYAFSPNSWMSTVCCDGVSYFKPTHFMPLPTPPKLNKE